MKKLTELNTGDSVKIINTINQNSEIRIITRTTQTQIITEFDTSTGTHEQKHNKNTGNNVGYDDHTYLVSNTENLTDIIKNVHVLLKARKIHPSGSFDKAGRFYAHNAALINVREPSRAFPYSHMTACRTLKYVKKVAEKFNCKTEKELIGSV